MYTVISQSFCLYGRKLNVVRYSSNIKNIVRSCNKFARTGNVCNERAAVSKLYPDYKIIYSFPYMKYAVRFNLVKNLQTVFAGATIPVSLGLKILDVTSNTQYFAIVGVMAALFLHSLSFTTYNLIGTIYYKKEDASVILSYLTYSGKRVDLKTSVEKIQSLTETPTNALSFLHRTLHVQPNHKLKLNMKYGEIYTKDEFNYICGAAV